MIKTIIVFGRNKKEAKKVTNKLLEFGIAAKMPVIAGIHMSSSVEKVIEAAEGKQIILAFKNEELKAVTEMFHKHGVFSLYICPVDTHYKDIENKIIEKYVIQIDNRKPRLDYIEIEVSECCNLNCKGCTAFSNLVQEHMFCDLSVVRNDLKKLRDYYWGIETIRLVGGEPFLNPDFVQFVETARKIFPDSDIRLVSNGLMIPTIEKKDLETLRENNCTVDVSNYPPTQKIIEKIIERLNEAGVLYNISVPINIFFKTLLSEPLESSKKAFDNCMFTHCHALKNGYLAACSFQICTYRLNEMFNSKYPVCDKIDIYQSALNGWEINDIFSKPHDFCRYCAQGIVPFKWKVCPKNRAKAEDWIVNPTFVNLTLVPVLQRATKLFMKPLRHLIRQRKSN